MPVISHRKIGSLLNGTLNRFGLEIRRLSSAGVEPGRPPDIRDGTFDHRFHADESSLPLGAAEYLRADNQRLRYLRELYARLDWPVCEHSRWRDETVRGWLNLKYFRGDNIIVWHYREDPQYNGPEFTRLFYFTYLRYVLDRGGSELVDRLGEDGAFGCWTYDFPGYPRCSRDLLDSVNELLFLDKHLSVISRKAFRILDIGAGYGRLAHRASQAINGLSDYCCVDAIAESTFLCEFYLGFRQISPPARVKPLDEVPSLEEGAFDLAVNVHSFSECRLDAIEWWMSQVARLGIPYVFVVPNEASGFLTTEGDSTRKDYLQTIESNGYRLIAEVPAIEDVGTRDVLEIHDRYCLFERR
ncbi:MAG TPA: putative sugar O-methyltransferase [Acidimicrobiales bacterium]